MTLVVTIGLTGYAYKTTTDITMKGGALFVAGICIFLFGLFAIITNSAVLYLFYCILLVFLYGVYLVYDT